MKNEAVMVEKELHAAAGSIWAALTDKERMKEWYFQMEEFRAEPGFEFRFMGGPDAQTQYEHICVVQEVVEGELLSYSWRYAGYEGESLVTFRLLPVNDTRTLVRITHSGLETFSHLNPDFARENFVEGWNGILGKALKGYVER